MKLQHLLPLFGLFFTLVVSAQTTTSPYPGGTEIFLWPASAPGSEKVRLTETVTERSKDPTLHDRMITGISKPSISAFLPENPNGTAILVAPGGGYRRVVIDKEGLEMAHFFTKQGITVFILKYRLPTEGHAEQTKVALQDAQRAMRLIRAGAKKWQLDPKRIGVMGFSAGGHLAASLTAYHDHNVYEPIDEADRLQARPDFQVLVYPAILIDAARMRRASEPSFIPATASDEEFDRQSLERHIHPNTPETFILQADDDSTVVPNHAIAYYQALKKAGRRCEMHIFRDGGHGFGIRGVAGKPAARWPELAMNWLRELGFSPAQ